MAATWTPWSAANGITNPNALQVGQKLTIPSTQVETGPAIHLLPDSEFVNGPAYVDFDTGAFAARQGGYLAEYYENVGGEVLSGPEIVELVAHHYSVGPRLLLAILELESGWVTNPSPGGAALTYPMGYRGGGWELLSRQLAWAADKLNQGYYDWRGRGVTLHHLGRRHGDPLRADPQRRHRRAALLFLAECQKEPVVDLGRRGAGQLYRDLSGAVWRSGRSTPSSRSSRPTRPARH